MDNEKFCCNVCSLDYDTKKHAPRILVECGHTLCSNCLTRILSDPKLRKCPFDNRRFPSQTLFHNFPLNYALIALYEEENKPNFCKVHNEKFTLVCLTDRVRICAECALFGDHKEHKMKRIKELRAQGQKTKEILQEGLENFNREKEEKEERCEQLKVWFLNEMEYQMNEMKLILNAKQLEWTNQMEGLFQTGRTKELMGFKKEVDQAIKDIYSACQDDNKWEILEKDYGSLTERLQSPSLEEEFLKMAGQATEMWSSVSKFFTGQKQAMLGFDLLNQERRTEGGHSENSHSKRMIRTKTRLRIQYTSESLTISFEGESPKVIEINIEEFKGTESVVIQISVYEFSAEEIPLLYYILSKLDKYTSLMVFFEPEGFTESYFFELLSAIFCGIQHVALLDINLDKCQISANSFLVFCSRILSQAIHLKSLRISLYSSGINNACLLALSFSLESLKKNLDVISLDLGNNEINDDGIKLIYGLMETVQVVEFRLKGTQITDEGLKEFGEKVLGEKLKGKIKELKLDLSKTKITNEGIFSIFRGLEKEIKVLNIKARRVKITERVIDLLNEEILGKLEGELEELKLDFDKGKIVRGKESLVEKMLRGFGKGRSYLREVIQIDDDDDDDL